MSWNVPMRMTAAAREDLYMLDLLTATVTGQRSGGAG
jgi:hypothetical protein